MIKTFHISCGSSSPEVIIIIIIIIIIEHFLIYKLLTPPPPPSKLRFEANLFREDSQSTEHSQKPEMISDRENSLSMKNLIK